DRDFLLYEDYRCTYGEHYRLVAALSHHLLQECGLVPGDRVAIAMRNYPEWAPVFWAVQAAGLIAVPLNAWWTANEMRYGLQDSGAKLVFADAERSELLDRTLPVIEIRGDGSTSGVRSWEDLLAELPAAGALPDVRIEPDDDATIMYTSGTTGRPKGAVATHRNHCTNALNTAVVRKATEIGRASCREREGSSAVAHVVKQR